MTLLLVGRLTAEARESKAAREDVFPQLLHDNLKATIWLGALLRNVFFGRGVSLCVSSFNVCILIWEWDAETVWEKPRLQGKWRSLYGKSVQLLHAALFFSSVFLHPSLDHLGTEFINTGWLLCPCSAGTVIWSSKQASAASEQAMLTLRWRVMFALQRLTLVFFVDKAAAFVNVCLRALVVIISMSKSANTTSSKNKLKKSSVTI